MDSTKDKTAEDDKAGIYKTECNDCDQVYIGQTRRNISTRFKEHVDMRRAVKSAVIAHITDKKHSITREGLKLVKQVNNEWELDAYESLYMHRHAENLMSTQEAPIRSPLFNIS